MATALPRCLLKHGRLPANSLYLISQCQYSAFSAARRGATKETKSLGITAWNLTSNGGYWPERSPLGHRFASNRSLPTVMQFPNIIWPSVLKTIKNWIMVNFIIKPYFDREFDMSDFVGGTKHALEVSVFGVDLELKR